LTTRISQLQSIIAVSADKFSVNWISHIVNDGADKYTIELGKMQRDIESSFQDIFDLARPYAPFSGDILQLIGVYSDIHSDIGSGFEAFKESVQKLPAHPTPEIVELIDSRHELLAEAIDSYKKFLRELHAEIGRRTQIESSYSLK